MLSVVLASKSPVESTNRKNKLCTIHGAPRDLPHYHYLPMTLLHSPGSAAIWCQGLCTMISSRSTSCRSCFALHSRSSACRSRPLSSAASRRSLARLYRQGQRANRVSPAASYLFVQIFPPNFLSGLLLMASALVSPPSIQPPDKRTLHNAVELLSTIGMLALYSRNSSAGTHFSTISRLCCPSTDVLLQVL